MVLNELNNLKIRGKDVSVGLKQDIYQNLFMKHRKVTREKLLRYLQESDQDLKKEDISGFDHDFKANLSSYMDFEKQVFGEKLAEDRVKKIVEDIIFWKTIYGDDSKMIESIIEQKCPEVLDREQLKTISRFRYKGWGNFSQEFLNGIMGSDKETGETFTIIEALWQTNCNLMQLLSERFTFKKEIERYNAELTGEIKEISYDALVKDLYVSPANKRAIWQTIQIVEEIRKIMGNAPKRIFVEMARGEQKEKKRTKSRKAHLLELYAACEKETRDWSREIEAHEERDFSSIKLYLYYTQMGRCMYTGQAIDFDELMSANSQWDRDHIYPQSKIKDDSLDNLVLVNKVYNAKKNSGIISPEIQKKQKEWWAELLEKNFISKKKYDRLTRTGEFSEDELAGFISRQLVETRQSSKVVAELLGRMYQDTKVIYVKSALVSQLRQELHVFKSRRVNDYHHAKDAYLNIVAGDVYDAKFTSNPRTWLKENPEAKYHMNRIFDFDVYRGKTRIWEGLELDEKKKARRNEENKKFGGTMDQIRATVKKNDIQYTEYTYCDNGKLFEETIVRKTDRAKIRLKADLDPQKYGGYTSAESSYFSLIEFDEKQGKRIRNIMEVPIYVANMLKHNPNAYLDYLTEIKGLKNAAILRACIKKNALLSINGFPMRIRGVDEKNLTLKNNLQPIFGEQEETIRRIEKFLEKDNSFEIDEKRDGLNEERLIELYDTLTKKLLTIYQKRPSNKGKFLAEKREEFEALSLREKAKVLDQIVTMLRCDIRSDADLTAIGGGPHVGKITMNKNTVGKEKLVLINQSVTGLFENRIEL